MSKKLKVEAIGTGGAFDTELINSSFYITMNNDSGVLVDCGYNVFPHLKEHRHDILENLDSVVITHLDDDHVGSLKSLLYYRYFILGKTTCLRYPPGLELDMAVFLPKNEEMVDGVYVKADIYEYLPLREFKDFGGKASIESFAFAIEGIHHVKSYGYVFGTVDGAMVAISGDTKANPIFEHTVNKISNVFNIQEEYILHDYSFFNDPLKNPHACESDLSDKYSIEFIGKLNFYHNNRNGLMGTIFEYGRDLQRYLDIGLKVEYLDYNHTERSYNDILNYLNNNKLSYTVFIATDPLTRMPILNNDTLATTEIVVNNEEGEEDVFYKMCDDFNVVGKVDGLDKLIIYVE